ncbi:hypothetical protein NDU88_004530 [Pleurodeles waltl]|uniref:Uncharacterized protein n=1 Tax=Pleurodeles waltl TaxID=8319 RepID=A0AAV7NU02_PLEWA|nr:hypothetical protein NDU88_004530 [Pleurodeles waltl]
MVRPAGWKEWWEPGGEETEGRAARAAVRVVAENKSHFFATPEAAWEWLESTGRASGGATERAAPVPRGKRNRAKRVRRRADIRAGPVACAPDLEQLMQERRAAIHSLRLSAHPRWRQSRTLNFPSRPVIDLSRRIASRSWDSSGARL